MTDERPTHLDLFSGIGGFALAAQWAGFRTIGFCEIDKYCQRILIKNFGAVRTTGGNQTCRPSGMPNCSKNFLADSAINGLDRGEIQGSVTTPVRDTTERPKQNSDTKRCSGSWTRENGCFSDIFDLDGREFAGVSLITGGFPCQPFSVAGKRRGAADDRAIWPEMFRVIKEARPNWIVAENVAGLSTMVEHNLFPPMGRDGSAEGEVGATFDRTGRGYLDEILESLEAIGYDVVPFVIPACAVDARHRRDRVWIVARNISDAIEQRGCSWNAERKHAINARERSCNQGNNGSGVAGWLPEPNVGRVAHGIPSRVDRLKGLGNAIVPQVAYQILKVIREFL